MNKYKHWLWINIIYLMLIYSCKTIKNKESYIPEWLTNNYQASNLIIGTSQKTLYLADAFENAFINGLVDYIKTRTVEINNTEYFINQNFISYSYELAIDLIKGATIKDFWIDKNGIYGEKGNLYLLIEINERKIQPVFYNLNETNSVIKEYEINEIIEKITKDWEKKVVKTKPEWIDGLSSEKFYVIGYSGKCLFVKDAVMNAVRNGIQRLHKNLGVKLKNMFIDIAVNTAEYQSENTEIKYKNLLPETLIKQIKLKQIWIDENGEKSNKGDVYVQLVFY